MIRASGTARWAMLHEFIESFCSSLYFLRCCVASISHLCLDRTKGSPSGKNAGFTPSPEKFCFVHWDCFAFLPFVQNFGNQITISHSQTPTSSTFVATICSTSEGSSSPFKTKTKEQTRLLDLFQTLPRYHW